MAAALTPITDRVQAVLASPAVASGVAAEATAADAAGSTAVGFELLGGRRAHLGGFFAEALFPGPGFQFIACVYACAGLLPKKPEHGSSCK